MHKSKNYVDVTFEFHIHNKKTNKNYFFSEKHPMRFLIQKILKNLAKNIFLQSSI